MRSYGDFWILVSCSDSHLSLSRLSALCLKMSNSSNIEYFLRANALRKVPPSIIFVRQSANIAWLHTQRSLQFSVNLSLIKRHSKVVLNSSHTGVEVFVDKSKTDLQSVAMDANGDSLSTSVGLVQSMLGSNSQDQIKRNQLSLSSVLLSAEASALKVLLMTRGILRLDQAIRQITESWF